jgi:hypothetical protein
MSKAGDVVENPVTGERVPVDRVAALAKDGVAAASVRKPTERTVWEGHFS